MEAQIIAYTNENEIKDAYVLDYSFEQILNSIVGKRSPWYNAPVRKDMYFKLEQNEILAIMRIKFLDAMPYNKYDADKKAVICQKCIPLYKEDEKQFQKTYKSMCDSMRLMALTPIEEYNLYSDCHLLWELLDFKNRNKELNIKIIPVGWEKEM